MIRVYQDYLGYTKVKILSFDFYWPLVKLATYRKAADQMNAADDSYWRQAAHNGSWENILRRHEKNLASACSKMTAKIAGLKL